MKRLITLLFILIGFVASAQTPIKNFNPQIFQISKGDTVKQVIQGDSSYFYSSEKLTIKADTIKFRGVIQGISATDTSGNALYPVVNGKVNITNPVINTAGNTIALPTTRGTANQYLKTDGAGVTSWADVSIGGGSVNDYVYVVDSLQGGRNLTGDGTMGKPYATLGYAEARSNNKGFKTIAFSGSFLPNYTLGSIDSLSWLCLDDYSVINTSSMPTTSYIFTSTSATGLNVFGKCNFITANSKGIANYVNTAGIINFNYNTITNSGSYDSFNFSCLKAIINGVSHSNSGSGNNYYFLPNISNADIVINTLTDAISGTGSVFKLTSLSQTAQDNKITLNSSLISNSSTNAISILTTYNIRTYLFFTGNLSCVNAANCEVACYTNFTTMNKAIGSMILVGESIINAPYINLSTYTLTNAIVNTRNTVNSTFNTSGTLTINGNTNNPGQALTTASNTGTLTINGNVTGGQGYFNGNVTVNGNITAATVQTGTTTINNGKVMYSSGGYTTITGTSTLILNSCTVDDLIYSNAATTKTLIAGNCRFTTNGRIIVDNGVVDFLDYGGNVFSGASNIAISSGKLMNHYGYGSSYSKNAITTVGTLTEILTTNNPITIDANVK